MKFAIDTAFNEGGAWRVYVEPNPTNAKAWALYEKMGFISKPRPNYLPDGDTYLEITKDEWNKRNEQAGEK